jgi:hypothetical protein
MTRSNRQPLLLPEGYQESTETTRLVTETGGTIDTKTHWSGRVDVNVGTPAVGLRITPMGPDSLSKEHAAAISRYEKAVREVTQARQANDQDWLTRAMHRFEKARDRLAEIQ